MAARGNRERGRQAAPQPHTLSAFLEENFRLVSVFGVLLAVSTFAGNLALRAIGIGLSFLFLVAAMLVWAELWRKFPRGGTHWVLFLFRSTLTLITCVIILYWLVFFRDYLGPALTVVFAIALMLTVAALAKRAGLIEMTFGPEGAMLSLGRLLLGAAAVLIVAAASFAVGAALSQLLAPFLTAVMQALYEYLQAAVPSTMAH